MIVYGDVFVVLNLIINSFILWVTAWCLGYKIKKSRLFLAALGGALYALGEVVPDLAIFYTPVGKLAMVCSLVLMAFGRKNVQQSCRLLAVFFVVSCLFGGAVLGWYYFIQSSPLLWQTPNPALKSVHLLGGGIIGAGLIFMSAKAFVGHSLHRKTYRTFQISCAGKRVELRGLIDTGNQLYSLLDHQPVIVVSRDALTTVLPETMKSLFSLTPEHFLAFPPDLTEKNWANRLEVIPYHALGVQKLLLGFRPDWVEVDSLRSQAVVAIAPETLSTDGRFQALLHPAIVPLKSSNKGAGLCA